MSRCPSRADGLGEIVVAAGDEVAFLLGTLEDEAGVGLRPGHVDRGIEQGLVGDHAAGFEPARG
jgi:hypothetical protein